MDNFLEGLSVEDQKRYCKLYEKFKGTEIIDEKKKYIPHLILLQEKGKLELLKKENTETI